MLKTGMIIAERYEIVSKIGTGGMADVYKAKDHKLNRFVAVKVLKAEFREDKTFIRKFRSEAQAAASLTHPNVVNIFDVGDDEGVYYIVMEVIEGITLKEYISKKGKLSIKEATSIAIQVSMGLEAAHSHGIVHRDVKPQNIIISTDGKVKVTDFGIARAASSNTISSNVMGSVHYSSPEQVRGGYSDEKSDIYSLGITLYEMVTGRVPFDGDTTVAIAIKHLQEEMVPPSVYVEDLPYSLEQIITKCTQKSVGRRYDKMEEVIADLKHSLIDPSGDFVTLNTLDNEAKTRVISDEELGEIKSTPKASARVHNKPQVEQLEDEVYENDYDDSDEEEVYARRKQRKSKNRNSSKRAVRRMFLILALLIGAGAMIYAIVFVAEKVGLTDMLNGNSSQIVQEAEVTPTPAENNMVEVPSLVGMTEEAAQELASSMSLGLKFKGEEASVQMKGNISSQDIAEGTMVEPFTTINYYISTGSSDMSIPDLDGLTGTEAQTKLESMRYSVTVTKEYCDSDSSGNAEVYPGYVYYTIPEEGSSAQYGTAVTLVISRGLNFGDGAIIPDAIGLTEEEALLKLAKFIDITIVREKNADVPAGTVINQDPYPYDEYGDSVYTDPDLPMTLTISNGNEDVVTETTVQEQAAATQSTEQIVVNTGEIWKCTQKLNTPDGYSGGAIRLELIQEVNGELKATVVSEGTVLTFPYKLDITGISGVSTGTLYCSELIDGVYQELGHYPIEFQKVE